MGSAARRPLYCGPLAHTCSFALPVTDRFLSPSSSHSLTSLALKPFSRASSTMASSRDSPFLVFHASDRWEQTKSQFLIAVALRNDEWADPASSHRLQIANALKASDSERHQLRVACVMNEFCGIWPEVRCQMNGPCFILLSSLIAGILFADFLPQQ